MPTPLPKATSSEVKVAFEGHPTHVGAYTKCLHYESELANSKNKLRHVRILGFLLLHAPTIDIRIEVSKCIHLCKDSSDLSDVGQFFERYFILPFKKFRGRTPIPSEHSSRCSFEVTKEQVKADITQAPKDHRDAKARALIRDSWRCVVTDWVDRGAPEDVIARLDQNTCTVYTQCAHIIPESTFLDVEPKSEDGRKLNYSASVLAVLRRFCVNINEFNGEKVHSLTNVMSMEMNMHDAFDRLELYFQSTLAENTYEIKLYDVRFPYVKRLVTFTTSDPVNLPVPSRELLDLHATCCKVAHLSGAGEYIDAIFRVAEEMDVLSADGASGDMFGYMLSSAPNYIADYQG